MRSVFGEYFVSPARIIGRGLTAHIEECEAEVGQFFDLFFRGTDGAVEHVESFDEITGATEHAQSLNSRFYAGAQ